MRIFLTGATGFIGGHTLRALIAHGHHVTCLLRPRTPRSRVRYLADVSGIETIEGEWTSPQTWLHRISGHDAVVNTVGIIRETRGTTFEMVHTRSPIALFETAARVGVHKVVQVSALGASDQAVSSYFRSKHAADQHLTMLDVPYVVLRPSFVYGPGDHSMTFFARLAALPITPVPGDGQYRFQPLHVDDLVRAIVTAVERDDLRAVTVDAGGGKILTFNVLLDQLAQRRGKTRGARKIHIPWGIMRLVATATDLLGRGPITSEELAMLRQGNYAPNEPFIAHFGFEPRAFMRNDQSN